MAVRHAVHLPQSDLAEDRNPAFNAFWKASLRRCGGILIVLTVLYAGAIWWGLRGDVEAAIRTVPFSTFGCVIGLVLVGITLRAVRWHYYVRHLHWPVPTGRSILAFLASLAFTATPGKAGEAVKSVLLSMHHEVPVSAGVGVLIVERLGDLIAVLVLALGGMVLVTGATSYLVLMGIAVAAVTFLVGNRRLHGPLLARIARVRRLSRAAEQLGRSLDACQRLLRPIPFLIGIGIAAVSWGCEGVAFYFLMRHGGVAIGFLQGLSIYGTATLAGALSALPGGLGGFEVVAVMLLSHLGAAIAVATPAIAIFRLCTLGLGILLGVAFMLVWMLLVAGSGRGTSLTSTRSEMTEVPRTDRFTGASIILPVMNETFSLRKTVEIIVNDAVDDVAEFLIVICNRTTPAARSTVEQLRHEFAPLVVVHEQRMPFLGGALREAFELARGSHVVLMASDLETDPALVETMIEEEKKRPNGIVTASRWSQGGSFQGYSTVKWLLNWVFQRCFSVMYGTPLTDMTYAYRIMPTRLVQAVHWEELRHPFLFETMIKPLRLGVDVKEIPAQWKARVEGESQNTFMRNFVYFRIGLKTRLCAKSRLLRTGQSIDPMSLGRKVQQ